MNWLFTALQSPTAWKSLVGFATAAGIALDQNQANAIVGLGIAIMAALNAWKHGKDSKS